MSTPLKKLMIRTWRGPLPEWNLRFRAITSLLTESGWDFIIINDWESVRMRVSIHLGITIPEQIDTRKPGDYDPANGVIFADLIQGYDFWGHFNLDCVYGRLSHFLPDAFLENIDIYGNDPGAVCGPFTIYRNCEKVNNLFRGAESRTCHPFNWQQNFSSPTFFGWDEGVFSHHVVCSALRGEIRFASGFLQAHDHMTIDHRELAGNYNASCFSAEHGGTFVPTSSPVVFESGGRLINNVTNQEIMMYHFNQTRRWPLG